MKFEAVVTFKTEPKNPANPNTRKQTVFVSADNASEAMMKIDESFPNNIAVKVVEVRE